MSEPLNLSDEEWNRLLQLLSDLAWYVGRTKVFVLPPLPEERKPK